MLNNDVLSSIFACNGNMFIDREALHTTRITSQVCGQWRDLMLTTPCLWAKLIDIDHISNLRSQKWRNELIRRSGDALLWIRVESTGRQVGHRNNGIVPFFFKLVSENSHRIQKLVILGPSWSLFQPTRSMLCFPAPQLEHYEATIAWAREELEHYEATKAWPRRDDRDNKAPIAPLFGNYAPMLRRFYLRDYLVDHRAPWVFHLHSIGLGSAYGVRDALAILSTAHNLQELKIEDIASREMETSIPIASLPQLKYLEYNGRSNQGAILLAHIDIPAGCSLTIRIDHFHDRTTITQEKPVILSFINIFARHVERFLQSHGFNHIDLDYAREKHISLIFHTALPIDRSFSIWIPLRGDSDSGLLEAFLRKITLLDLSSLTKLSFAADGRLNPCFGLFFSKLPAVETISVDIPTLFHLERLQRKYVSKRPSVLFPVLKVIDIPGRYFSCVSEAAAAFLLSRLREGYPITTLDMSNYSPRGAPPDLDMIAEVWGLKVLYRLSSVKGVVEYICGSHDPQALSKHLINISKL